MTNPAYPPCELDVDHGAVSVFALSDAELRAALPILVEGLACGADVQTEVDAVRAELARRNKRGIRRV